MNRYALGALLFVIFFTTSAMAERALSPEGIRFFSLLDKIQELNSFRRMVQEKAKKECSAADLREYSCASFSEVDFFLENQLGDEVKKA